MGMNYYYEIEIKRIPLGEVPIVEADGEVDSRVFINHEFDEEKHQRLAKRSSMEESPMFELHIHDNGIDGDGIELEINQCLGPIESPNTFLRLTIADETAVLIVEALSAVLKLKNAEKNL